MKKLNSILSYLLIFFLLSAPLAAQDVRTLNTKVADILAQMPAKSNEHVNKVMAQTLSIGDAGISQMLNMLKTAGQGNDVAVRFTLTSLARYSSQQGHENEWTLVQGCFLKAIAGSPDKEIQAYLIHQLNHGANDGVIDPLKTYLSDDRLCEPVTQLFLNIKSPKTEQALLDAFAQSKGDKQVTLIKALGELKSTKALTGITKLAGAGPVELQRSVLAALANIASPESYPLLWNAATKYSFKYEPTEAVAAFLKYTAQLGKSGKLAECKKACLDIIKSNSTADLLYNQEAALVIYAGHFPQEALPLILKNIDSPDSSYRMALLQTAKGMNDAAFVQKWVKRAATVSAATKADIVYMLGERKDKTAVPFIQQSLKDKNPAVRKAAVWALVKTDAQTAQKTLLTYLAQGNEPETSARALETLYDGSQLDEPVKLLGTATNPGKAGLIALIASKGGSKYFNEIFGLAVNDDPVIKLAAISALKHISSFSNIDALLNLLNTSNDSLSVAEIRLAIENAADTLAPDKASAPVIAELQKSAQKDKLLPILAAIGGSNALKEVTSLFESSQGSLKQASLNALVNWKDASATASLYQVCKSGNEAFRAQAFSGFVNQLQNSGWPDDQKLLKLQMIMPFAQTTAEKLSGIEVLSELKTFLALLYASKFMDDPELSPAAANAATQIALPAAGSTTGLYGDIPKSILKKALEKLTGDEVDYTRAKVNKYMESMPADPGFVSMFNGKDLSGWKGFVTDPIKLANLKPKELAKLQLKANEKLHNNWSVKDGMIVFSGEGDNLLSDKEYGDFEMIVNWKISKKGDSGIYLRGSPQVQIWDTTRVEVGAQVGSGGLYNNQKNPSKPLKVADNPIEEWNTFHITMIGEKVTVYLNGELVVDNVTLENYWDRNQSIFPTGTVELQAHGTDLAFKDIYIHELKNQGMTLSPEEKKEGFVSLFNGKNLDGWVGDKVSYHALDNQIVIQPSEGEGGGNLYTENEYGDFVFRFEFQLTPGANNGLGVRAPLEGDAAYVGMELQILDNTAPVYANLKPYQYHGSVYGVIPAKRDFLKPLGEWNYEEVILQGSKVKIILNGTVIVDGDIKEASKNGTMDGKDHPGLKRDRGHVGFLGHGSVVKFRNIRIKEL